MKGAKLTMVIRHFGFECVGYHKDWDTAHKYGTAWKNEAGSWAVYDGKTNYMGKITAELEFDYNGEPSDYKTAFLYSAKEEILKLQK